MFDDVIEGIIEAWFILLHQWRGGDAQHHHPLMHALCRSSAEGDGEMLHFFKMSMERYRGHKSVKYSASVTMTTDDVFIIFVDIFFFL